MLQDSYVNQRNVQARTVAEVVGVVPKKTIYTEVFREFLVEKTHKKIRLDLSTVILKLITPLWASIRPARAKAKRSRLGKILPSCSMDRDWNRRELVSVFKKEKF